MTHDNQAQSVSPSVRRVLQSVRILLRKYIFARAALMIAVWLLAIFWIGGFLDYLPVTAGSNETPRWLRVGLLLLMVVGSLWVIVVWGLPRMFARIRDRSIALLIERHYPQLNNELVTAIDLAQEYSNPVHEVSNPEAHRQMLNRVRSSLEEKIGAVEPATLFNWQPIWSVGVAVAFGLVMTLIAAIGMPEWIGLWSKRLFALSEESWPRKAELRADGVQLQLPTFSGQLAAERSLLPFVDGVVRVPAGSTALLQISAEASTKTAPDVCTLFYRSADGGRGRANLRRIGSPKDDWQPFALDGPPLDGISSDMTLDIIGLDARLRDLHLEIVDPAVITSLELKSTYPKYLLDSLSRPEAEVVAYRSGMKIPQGTVVSLVGESSAPLRAVQYAIRSAATNAEEQSKLEILSAPTNGTQFEIQLGPIFSSQVVEIRLLDQYGLSSEQIPRYVLTMQEDSIPEVKSKLNGIGNAITAVAKLPLSGRVTDDHGIAKVTAEIASGENSAINVDLELAAEGALDVEIDLNRMRELGTFSVEAGETIGMVVTARDFFDLNNEIHVGRGQSQQLAVVTADELLVLLDRQELELRQRLELIVAELEQLRDVLQLLAAETAMENAHLRRSRNISLVSAVALKQPGDEDVALQKRMRTIRAQQSVLQGDKSQQELAGVAARVEDIRRQLQNNRIDSYDRQARLQEKVYQPLIAMLDVEYQKFQGGLTELQTATMSGAGDQQAKTAIRALDEVLVKLLAIKESMMNIESFNEIVDLVRGLLEDQDRLLEQTQEMQRAKILQLLQ